MWCQSLFSIDKELTSKEAWSPCPSCWEILPSHLLPIPFEKRDPSWYQTSYQRLDSFERAKAILRSFLKKLFKLTSISESFFRKLFEFFT